MEKRIEKGVVQRSGEEDWLRVTLWITLILLVVGSVIVMGDRSWAQTSGLDPKVTYQSGQVTSKQGNAVQINKRDYILRRDAVINDDEGRPREEKDLVPGTEVKFHLKHGSIDQIIIRLPR